MPGESSTTLMTTTAPDPDAWSIAVVGALGVGKTRFISAFVLDDVEDELEPLGVKQAFSRKLTVDDQATIVTLLDIYQLESETEDEHEALLRTSDAFILMYNVTSPYSFQDTVAFLREIRRATSSREPVIVLAANQIDRPAQDHEVPHQDGVALAKELGCSFTETSAKTGLEVDATVINLVRALRAKKKGEERRKKNSLGLRVWKLVSRAR